MFFAPAQSRAKFMGNREALSRRSKRVNEAIDVSPQTSRVACRNDREVINQNLQHAFWTCASMLSTSREIRPTCNVLQMFIYYSLRLLVVSCTAFGPLTVSLVWNAVLRADGYVTSARKLIVWHISPCLPCL